MTDHRKSVRLNWTEMKLIQRLRCLRRGENHGIMVIKWEPDALSIVTKTGQLEALGNDSGRKSQAECSS
jgi:hypothetical protein